MQVAWFSCTYDKLLEMKKKVLSIPLKSDEEISSENFLNLADQKQLQNAIFELESLEEFGDSGYKLAGAMASVVLAHKYLQIVSNEIFESGFPLIEITNETIH